MKKEEFEGLAVAREYGPCPGKGGFAKVFRMKRLAFLLAAVVAVWSMNGQASYHESDTMDVLHYSLDLDMGHSDAESFSGSCRVTLRLLQPVEEVGLGLMNAAIGGLRVGDSVVEDFDYAFGRLHVPVLGAEVGDTLEVTVDYQSWGYVGVDGGFWCDAAHQLFYNLGEDRYKRPFSMGRSWFPCSDSVYDKATYDFRLTAPKGWSAICSGVLDSTLLNADSSSTFCYSLVHPVSTYQVGVGVAPYRVLRRTFEGMGGTYTFHAAYRNGSPDMVERLTGLLVPFYEELFGPYRWDEIGYCAAGDNAGMEHVNNISVNQTPFTRDNYQSEFLVAHEFAHQWFGNLVTCARIQDMWFNEGGASFADQLAMRMLMPEESAIQQLYNNYMIISRVPFMEEGFHALCGMPEQYSFMNNTYYKGAMVFHELRHLLGDSVFFGSMRELLDRNAFTAMDTYQIRDSLSLYSGTDLTDFFDFHIFAPGFAEYSLDSMRTEGGETTLWISQHLWGAPEVCREARVPVTLFSAEGDTATVDVASHGATASGQFRLPFVPVYGVVDYYDYLADANVVETMKVRGKGSFFSTPINSFKLNVTKFVDTVSFVCSQHWSTPDYDPIPGVVRWANHRMIVQGVMPEGMKAQLLVPYSNSVNDIDQGFCDESGTRDSLRVFYRATPADRWELVEATDVNDSYMSTCLKTSTFRPGEYILAVVDTATLGIEAAVTEVAGFDLLPNPAHEVVTIVCGRGCAQGACSLTVRDAVGREVLRQAVQGNKQKIDISSLPQGVYFVTLTTKEGNSTRKLMKL